MNQSIGSSLQGSPTPEPSRFRVIAYAGEAIIPSLIPYDRLTHINYAFLIPNGDGTFKPLLNQWKLNELISLAHQHAVKVLISVGGWGWDTQFRQMAASPETRRAFVRNLDRVITDYHFDGADIDWEYPDPGPSGQDFLSLMQELRAAWPKDRLLTAAVVALGEHGQGILTEVFPLMDFVNIMAYDNDTEPQHSSLDYAQSALDYWLGRGLPPEKATLGVPFYARPLEIPYSRIVNEDPSAALRDTTSFGGTLLSYNGIPTIQAKTRLALQRASGIMFWSLENDAGGELSLVEAIHRVVMEAGK